MRGTTVWIVAGLAAGVACGPPFEREQRWVVDGEPASARIHMATERDADEILVDIHDGMLRVKTKISDSVEGGLARVNREAAVDYVTIDDPDLYSCVSMALDYARVSRGAFDPTVGVLMPLYAGAGLPTDDAIAELLPHVGWDRVTLETEARAVRFLDPGIRLDLNGLIDGYALDVAARAFSRSGSRAGLLRLGHAALAWRSPPGRTSWSVEMPDPRGSRGTFVAVEVANRGLAVAGRREERSGERVVLDPATGRPATGEVLAALAIAHSAADADAIATALVASGFYRAGDLLSRLQRVETVLLIAGDGQPYLLASGTLDGRLTVAPGIDEEIGSRVRYLLPPQPAP